MKIPNPETSGGEPVLRREAGKALNGRVPMVLAIALAALSGMLVGYGVRALAVQDRIVHRVMVCPHRFRARPTLLLPPATEAEGARAHRFRPRPMLRPPAELLPPAKPAYGEPAAR